jgi:hypothetical protein
MKFTFRHRKAIANVTLAAVLTVLLLAFVFTVFSAPRYEGSLQDNIMLTAEDMGNFIPSTEISLVNTRNHEGSGGILPFHFSPSAFQKNDGFILTIALFALLLAAGFRVASSELTPVSLRTRIDQ